MFEYDFMRHAFMASGMVAIIAGIVGFFLVMRGQTFAGHALSHVGFTGATGAALIGLSPLWGSIAFTLIAGILMGFLGEKLSDRDVGVGTVLSLSLGMGLLFLHFSKTYALPITTLLFGNVLAISMPMLYILLLLSIVSLLVLGFIMRPLIFATLQPELAQAKGVSLRLISVAFLTIVALAVAECTQIVGVLLVFTLMVGPAAAAWNITKRLSTGILISILLALAEAWAALFLAFHTNWPTSFWITALSASIYGFSLCLFRMTQK
jgi:zinc/manganese transport system permease protein